MQIFDVVVILTYDDDPPIVQCYSNAVDLCRGKVLQFTLGFLFFSANPIAHFLQQV